MTEMIDPKLQKRADLGRAGNDRTVSAALSWI